MAFATPPTEKESVKGTKENKIRFFGTPTQIFKNFSTVKDEDGNDAMTYQDFFNALTPFNYQKVKDNSKYFNRNHCGID